MALAAAAGSQGPSRRRPEPFPGEPPELSLIVAPLMAMPPGSSLIQLPPALRVSSLPASITTFSPALRWISWPASTNWPVPIWMC
ncbi:hypothetical protein D9M69_660290 [compost metagenome]